MSGQFSASWPDDTNWTADTQEQKMRVIKDIFIYLQSANQEKLLEYLERIKCERKKISDAIEGETRP